MILFVHMLFGAAVGSSMKYIPLAIIMAFLSHYFLDFIPHIDYDVRTKKGKYLYGRLPAITKVFFDMCLGFLLIFIFSKSTLPTGKQTIIYLYAIIAIIPDSLTVLSGIFPNKILKAHTHIHTQKVHFLKEDPSAGSGQEKISRFWRIFSQIATVIISIILIRL